MQATAQIIFVDPDSGKLSYAIRPHRLPAKRVGVFETRPVLKWKARLLDNVPTLDINGFQLMWYENSLLAGIDEADSTAGAYVEVEAAILKAPGADILIMRYGAALLLILNVELPAMYLWSMTGLIMMLVALL